MDVLMKLYPGDAGILFLATILAQVTLVTAGALLLIRLAGPRRAALRHAIALCALLAVLISPALAWGVARYPLAMLRVPLPSAESPTYEPEAVSAAAEAPAPGPAARPAPTEASAEREVGRPILGALVAIWLGGGAILLLRFAHGLGFRYAVCRHGSRMASEEEARLLDAVRARLGRPVPAILLSRSISSPLSTGIVRPRVLLPADLPEALAPDQLRDVVVHECAHVVRKDHWVGMLQRIGGMLFWPHPLVHILNRLLARAREEICDNFVISERAPADYAETLLATSAMPVIKIPATAALLSPRWQLRQRISGLLDGRRSTVTRVHGLMFALLMAVFLGVAACSGVRDGTPDSMEERFINAFLEAEPGVELRNIELRENWWERTLVLPVGVQTGVWYVWIEAGTTVFTLHPGCVEDEGDNLCDFDCVVLKVDAPRLSTEDLLAAFQGRGEKALHAVEFSIHGPERESVHKAGEQTADEELRTGAGGFYIYMESWDRVSFREPNMRDEDGSKWYSRAEATQIIRDFLELVGARADVLLGKNLHINGAGFEADLDTIQEWLVSIGIRDITLWQARSRGPAPLVRKCRDGKTVNVEAEEKRGASEPTKAGSQSQPDEEAYARGCGSRILTLYDQLEVGMTREEVEAIVGGPILPPLEQPDGEAQCSYVEERERLLGRHESPWGLGGIVVVYKEGRLVKKQYNHQAVKREHMEAYEARAVLFLIEARVVKDHAGDKYYYYDVEVLKVIKKSTEEELESPLRVARVNYEAQPEVGKTYTLGLHYYNEAHPEYGLKIVSLKEKLAALDALRPPSLQLPENASVTYERCDDRDKRTTVAVEGELADRIIAELNDEPDTAEADAGMGLDTLKYLHVGTRTFQVLPHVLVLMDDWGIREWHVENIGAALDALMPGAADEEDAGDDK